MYCVEIVDVVKRATIPADVLVNVTGQIVVVVSTSMVVMYTAEELAATAFGGTFLKEGDEPSDCTVPVTAIAAGTTEGEELLGTL